MGKQNKQQSTKSSQLQQPNTSQMKRGQRSRLNKIKNKYKDQDDEDKELIMQYLAVCLHIIKNIHLVSYKRIFYVLARRKKEH